MRKLSILLVAIAVAVGLTACGNRNDSGATDGNNMTILPTNMPTLDTNIPDPEVDTQMPMYTDGTVTTDPMVGESGTADANRK